MRLRAVAPHVVATLLPMLLLARPLAQWLTRGPCTDATELLTAEVVIVALAAAVATLPAIAPTRFRLPASIAAGGVVVAFVFGPSMNVALSLSIAHANGGAASPIAPFFGFAGAGAIAVLFGASSAAVFRARALGTRDAFDRVLATAGSSCIVLTALAVPFRALQWVDAAAAAAAACVLVGALAVSTAWMRAWLRAGRLDRAYDDRDPEWTIRARDASTAAPPLLSTPTATDAVIVARTTRNETYRDGAGERIVASVPASREVGVRAAHAVARTMAIHLVVAFALIGVGALIARDLTGWRPPPDCTRDE